MSELLLQASLTYIHYEKTPDTLIGLLDQDLPIYRPWEGKTSSLQHNSNEFDRLLHKRYLEGNQDIMRKDSSNGQERNVLQYTYCTIRIRVF